MTAAKDISALAFLLLLPSVSYAQARGCDSHTIVVNVRDRHGKFVSSLQASDFRAKLDGKHVTIVSMTQGPAPKRVVIVLDRSGSMSSELRRRSTQSIVSELIRTLPETTQFALVVFGSRIQGTVKFGHSSAEMLSVMDRLTNSAGEGQTALRDALQYAGDIFSPTQVGDSVVAISNGKDNLSKTSLNALKQTYWLKRIRLFLLFQINDLDYFEGREGLSPEVVRAKELARLGAATGGNALMIPDPKPAKVLSATNEIKDQIDNYYLVQIATHETLGKISSVQLEVVGSSGRKEKDVELVFPRKIWPCRF